MPSPRSSVRAIRSIGPSTINATSAVARRSAGTTDSSQAPPAPLLSAVLACESTSTIGKSHNVPARSTIIPCRSASKHFQHDHLQAPTASAKPTWSEKLPAARMSQNDGSSQNGAQLTYQARKLMPARLGADPGTVGGSLRLRPHSVERTSVAPSSLQMNVLGSDDRSLHRFPMIGAGKGFSSKSSAEPPSTKS